MYWTGQVDGPGGENFSFFANWVSTEDRFVPQDDGFLIVIRTGSGTHRLWITGETMLSLVEHDPSILRIPLNLAASEELHVEPQFALNLDWDDKSLVGPKEEYGELLKRTES